jgi:signal transduction histidine kinase
MYARDALDDLFINSKARFSVSGSGSIMADQGHLLAILINMFDNAIKYCPPGRAPKIGVAIKHLTSDEVEGRGPSDWTPATGEWFAVSIADNGVGIEKRHRERIFDFGYRIAPP